MIGMGGDYPPGVSRVSPVRKFLDAVGESSPVVLGACKERRIVVRATALGRFWLLKSLQLVLRLGCFTKEIIVERRKRMKKRNKTLKKITCIALAGMICAQMIPAKVFANGIANWNLYFNPTRPPAESAMSWKSSSLVATKSTAECRISGGNAGTSVYFINDFGQTEATKSKYATLPTARGHVYVFTVKYHNPTNSINTTRGTITY